MQETHKWVKEILIDNITSQEDADKYERCAISLDRIANKEKNINICNGGRGYIGNGVSNAFWNFEKRKLTEETKRKISEAQKGIPRGPHTEEEKRHISEALKGKNKGKKHSVEQNERHRALLKTTIANMSDEERKQKFRNSSTWTKDNNPNKGKKLTEEQKAKIAELTKEGLKEFNERLKQDKLDYYKYKADGGELVWNQWRKARKEGKL